MDQKVSPLLEDSLLNVWSERDEEKRIRVMQQIYAPDIVFYETDAGPAITGQQEINELIKKLQSQWSSKFSFKLITPVVSNHGVSHVAWTLGVPSEPPAASGMDIALIEHGRIKSLYLYLNDPLH